MQLFGWPALVSHIFFLIGGYFISNISNTKKSTSLPRNKVYIVLNLSKFEFYSEYKNKPSKILLAKFNKKYRNGICLISKQIIKSYPSENNLMFSISIKKSPKIISKINKIIKNGHKILIVNIENKNQMNIKICKYKPTITYGKFN